MTELYAWMQKHAAVGYPGSYFRDVAPADRHPIAQHNVEKAMTPAHPSYVPMERILGSHEGNVIFPGASIAEVPPGFRFDDNAIQLPNETTHRLLGKDVPLSHVATHEVGHALNHKKWWGPLLQNSLAHWGSIGAGFAGIPWGLTESDHAGRNAALTSLALSAPKVLSEGLASTRGHSLLKGLGAQHPELRDYRGSMARAFSTYALPAGFAAAMSAYSANNIQRNRRAQSALAQPPQDAQVAP